MKTIKDMIDAIYEKIANKEINDAQYMLNELNTNWDIKYNHYDEMFDLVNNKVMIGDVLDWLYKDNLFLSDAHRKWEDVILLWEEKRKPIEEQSDECINYIYNLLWEWKQ